MAGLFLNAFPVNCTGELRLWRVPRREKKRELQRRLGIYVWGEGDWFYAAREIAVDGASEVEVDATVANDLQLFVMREALLAHAAESGLEAWPALGNEIHCAGLQDAMDVGPFEVVPTLRLHVGPEEHVPSHAVLRARERMTWLTLGRLTDMSLAALALGQRAIRRDGCGPRRGSVEQLDDDGVVLRVGRETITVNAADYALSVNSRLAVQLAGSDGFRQLRVASGAETVSGHKNRYAVEQRFRDAGSMLRRLGLEIPLPGGKGTMTVSRRPVSVRLEPT